MIKNSIRILGLITLCFLAAPFSAVAAEVSSFQGLSWNYYSVEGNEGNSFYPSGESDYLYEGSFRYSTLLQGERQLFGNISYRSTDDKLIDTQSASLENMYLGIKSDAGEFLAGDFYSNFSEYSLSNALKGLKMTFQADEPTRLILVAGLDTAKWEDLWEERCDDSLNRRSVWGARLENSFLQNRLSLNLNYAAGRDDAAYASTPIMTNVVSIDGRYTFNRFLTFSSELAQGYVDQDIAHDGATKADRAIKLACDFNLKDYSLVSKYSRVGPHFTTTGGFTAQDLEALGFDGMWYLPLKMRLSHYLHTDQDNLSDTKSTTTRQLNPGVRLDCSLPKDVSAFLSADFRRRRSSDKNTDDTTSAYSTGLTRDFRVFYASVNYTKTIVASDVVATQERSADMVSLGLDGNRDFGGGLRFSWNLSENVSFEKYQEASDSDCTNATNAGVRVDFPSSLSVEVRAGFSDSDFYLNDTDSTMTQYYCALSRRLIRDLSFNVSFERRDYNFAENGNNYIENITRAGLFYTF